MTGKPDGGRPQGSRSTIELLARLMGAGWYVALSIAGGAGAGYWLDGKFDTGPVLVLVGLALGIVVAFAGMIRILNAMWDDGAAGPAPRSVERDDSTED